MARRAQHSFQFDGLRVSCAFQPPGD